MLTRVYKLGQELSLSTLGARYSTAIERTTRGMGVREDDKAREREDENPRIRENAEKPRMRGNAENLRI